MTGGATLGRAWRPRFRWREARLLLVVAIALGLGWLSLATQEAGRLSAGDPTVLAGYLILLAAVHLVLVVGGRRSDEVLFPTVALLGGISLLFMERLPQGLVRQTLGPLHLGLAQVQLAWLVLSFAALAVVAVAVRADNWLRYYKYTWAVVGIALLLAVFALGREVNGVRLSIGIGPLTGQPSELLKVILVIFLAAYLAELRPLLARSSWRVGPASLPPLPYLLPMLVMWGISLVVVVVQRDLGAALLFFSVFLILLYVATQRASYVVVGVLLFLAGSALLYQVVPRVRERIDIWIDPWSTAQSTGYQVVRALYALGSGGILGTGLGAGLPSVGGVPAIPLVQSDFAFAGLAEELGLAGAFVLLACYLVIAERGLRIAARSRDEFRALLAAGLTLVIVVQAVIIIGGDAKLIPLTGVTAPFLSYGGSSLAVNGLIVGLLLWLSDPGIQAPPPPRPATRRERLARRVRGAVGRMQRAVT